MCKLREHQNEEERSWKCLKWSDYFELVCCWHFTTQGRVALKGQQLVKQLQKYVTSAECNAITSNMLPNMKLSSIKLNIIHIQAYMTFILGFIALIFQFSCHFGANSYLNICSTSDECGRVRGGSLCVCLCVWMKSAPTCSQWAFGYHCGVHSRAIFPAFFLLFLGVLILSIFLQKCLLSSLQTKWL